MNVYLLNPPFKKNFVRCGRWQGASARSGGLDYPKWLAYATALLEKHFDKIRLVDAVAKKWNPKEVINDIIEFKPDVVVLDSNFSSLSNDIKISRLIKNNTNSTTILVGPPVSQYTEKILKNTCIDIVAKYEYEYTLVELINTLDKEKDLKNVNGISYRKSKKIYHNPNRSFINSKDLDKIPFVSKVYKRHLNIKDYFLSQSLYPEVQIFTGRGCPNRCTFCSWPETLMGRNYRSRSAENIVDEFEWINKNLKEVKEIFIEDDTFTINKQLVRSVCSEINNRDINITWSCNARADIDYETLKLMKKAGCRLLIVGYESGNQKLLNNIKKGTNIRQMRKFTDDAKKANLLIHGDFIIGLPGENQKTAKNTFNFIKEIKPNILQVSVATPIPGTDFFDWVKNNGYLLVDNLEESIDENGFQKCIISYPRFTKEEIEECVDKILKNYYISPSFIPIIFKNIIRENGVSELKIMLRSAKEFLNYSVRGK